MVQKLEEGGVVRRINLVGGGEGEDTTACPDHSFIGKLAFHPRRQTLAFLSICRSNDERLAVFAARIPMSFDTVPVIRGCWKGGDFGGRG